MSLERNSSLTDVLKTDAIKTAHEFGIKKIDSIQLGHTLPLLEQFIRVQGDEVVRDGKGQYKDLIIPIEGTFTIEKPEFDVVEFVEIKIRGVETRISTYGINLDVAQDVLTKFYTTKHYYKSSLNDESRPPDECVLKPKALSHDEEEDEYDICLAGCYIIHFRIVDGQIVIIDYDHYIP